jgi:hypothetical protein
VGVVLFVVFKFSDVKSLVVVGGDESVILSADGVVDVVFSDVDRVDGVVGESAVFDFDLYVKSLGRPIGGASEVDGDGDLMTTGPDGKDNVPVVAAAVRKRVGKKKFDVNDRQQREDKIVEMYNAGSTAGEISDFIRSQKPVDGRFSDIANIRSVVGKRRKRGDVALRVDSPNNVVNALKERDAGILKLYNEGKLDGPKIGALFGVGSMTVYGVVKRNRLKNPRSVARGDKLREKSLYWSHDDAVSGVVWASNNDLEWFSYSHPIEGFEGVLEHSEKGEVLRDPKGGLTAAGRRHFRETEGSNLLPGVRGRANTPTKMRRKGSFLTRFFTNPSGPMKDEKGKPTRLALSAAAWGEPVPQNMEDAAELAAKGRRLLERYANSKKKSADGDNL